MANEKRHSPVFVRVYWDDAAEHKSGLEPGAVATVPQEDNGYARIQGKAIVLCSHRCHDVDAQEIRGSEMAIPLGMVTRIVTLLEGPEIRVKDLPREVRPRKTRTKPAPSQDGASGMATATTGGRAGNGCSGVQPPPSNAEEGGSRRRIVDNSERKEPSDHADAS